ncbi:MAG: cell surface protein SprA, partial [candidate division Zixibacteria bacterium]|nr:cell surface protein SprA [candidate division Zixibacteria bacterium]
MLYLLEQHQKTAKGVLSSLGLAVLFLFALTLAGFLIGPSAEAVGLEIQLDEKDRSLVRFGHLPRQAGLSISSDSIPLLKTNLRTSQKVLVKYEHGFVSISEKQGNYQLYKPIFLTLSAYSSASNRLHIDQEWRKNLNTHFLRGRGKSKGLFEWEIPVKFPKVVSRIIGEGGPGLKVSGYRKISFSGRSMWEDDLKNTATSRQSKFPSLHMEQHSSFTINGTIGSKISVKVDQDSRRHTDLENTLQLRYKGEEDEIIQTIEAGNTNLSVRSGVVGYGERKQGLFGIKTTARIGGWNLTMITSQDKGSTQRAEFKAGAETHAYKIRDYNYLKRTFYDLGYAHDFAEGDSIVEIKLFKSNKTINSNTAENPAPFGNTYVDPEDTSASYSEGSFRRRFQEIDANDYFIQRDQHWIQFFSQLGTEDILAAYYEVLRSDGRVDTVGFLKDSCTSAEAETCMTLKLIKPDTPKPTDYTWEYEWKNVYFLNDRNIEREGFRLDIYKGLPYAENIEEDPNYQDSTRYLRIFGLDRLDLNAEENPDGIVDYRQIDFGLGYLIFPNRHPFAPYPNISFTENPGDTLKDENKVESIYSWDEPNQPSEDSRYYIYVQSSSRASQFRLGHAPIIEGSDVVTLNGRTLTRGEDYTIFYETGEITFMNPEASSPTAELSVDYEYAPLLMPEKKSMFGMVAEYNLGRNFRFGTVGIYKSEKTADERPRVGQEPIRNFIWGSNLTFTSSPFFITRMLGSIPWVKTDAPSTVTFKGDIAQSVPNPNTKNQAFIDDFEGSLQYTDLSVRRGMWTLSSPPEGKDISARCKMWRFNPYDQVSITDIWPNKEVERNEERTNVLELKFFPKEPHRPSNQDFDSSWVERSWNAIMRPLYPGAYDQTRTKFLEIWVHGNKGILHVDLGEISEDLDGDRVLDTEDKPRNGQRDGILDDDEDVGLDGLSDSEEQQIYNSSLSDPSGDNWNYDERYDYSHINGTQGNRNDPDRGRRPDTEDINSNSVLDLTNDYFEFTIDISKSEFLGDLSDSLGWRLYRIPLKDPQNYVKVGDPDWSEIRFARLWVSAKENCTIRIASIQLVGNRWENMGISSLTNRQTPLPVGTPPDEEFEIFVVNTHENPGYIPPPKVAGTLNRRTGVREKEQSLALRYENLKSNHQGTAYRILYRPEDYTSYRYLKMFLHGPDDPGEILFFLRLGSDSSNFYEFHTQIHPDWDERNEVVIDFDQITALKAYALNTRPPNSREPIDTTAGSYRVRGKPTLNKIRWFSLGVINADTINFQPVSGEIWVDELRVTDIRKEKGIAGSMNLTAKLADLANLSFSFRKQDSQFRSLTQKKESTNSTMNYRLNLNGIQVHRFLPVSLGYMLPVSLNYSRTLDLPKWKRGSDIVLPKDLREKEKRESTSLGITFSPTFSHPTTNWLVGLTLKRMSHSFNYSTSRSTSLQTPVQRNSTTGISGGYTFPLGRGLSLKPFGWLKSALVPKSFTQMSLSLLPTSVSVNGSINESRSHTENNIGDIFNTLSKTFNGNLNAQASPIKGIPLTYVMTTSRDIRDPKTIKYSLNPKKAQLGIETRYSESFSAKYTPSWLTFLDASFAFDSRYNENADKLNSYNFGGTRTISNSNNRSARFTLNWQRLLGGGGQKKEEKKPSFLNPLNLLRKLTQRIDPVNLTYRKSQTFNKSGLLARPGLNYRLGFRDDPKVGRRGSAQSTDRISTSENYSAKSGFKLLSTHIGMNYSRSVSRTITATEATKSASTRFPDLGFSLGKLANLRVFRKFFTNLTYNLSYFRQVDERGSER